MRSAAWDDVVTFFRLGNRSRLRQHLLYEGERLQEEVQKLADEILPKLEARRRESETPPK
jgi:hypothetical protein